jgi:hypothetical protein
MATPHAHSETHAAFPDDYLVTLRAQIRKHPLFTVNNLNRDFVGTRGFSVAFTHEGRAKVAGNFPWLAPYLDRVLDPGCNAFYLNPLQLEGGSRVDPHVDRSLRAYCNDIATPFCVSVLYVDVPAGMRGGRLVLQRGKKLLARVQPTANLLVTFDGDLLHSVERLESPGLRLSLVCEQYALDARELAEVPAYNVESRARAY